jgi:hypothetical protein
VPTERNLHGASSLPQEPRFQRPKPKAGLKSEAHAILSYLRLDMRIPSGQIETQLRKLKGIKDVTTNHVSHAVKIRYDPRIVTIEEIRTVLKNTRSGH